MSDHPRVQYGGAAGAGTRAPGIGQEFTSRPSDGYGSAHRFPGVDISVDLPVALRWVFAVIALLQLLSVLSVLRRMRLPDPGARAVARWDFLEAFGFLAATSGLLLGSGVLGLGGIVLAFGVGAVKGVRYLRGRRANRPGAAA
ncbi:hypothetical protein GCM10010329_51490 [Streptomyces spiroverticillatus]|uniref:DUF2516 family protein n=1 Tax=Streptomyces finlayi TaxID=67296 RepID=A0A918X1Y3_9ACTN|nr:hypothetical protein GCM10010329_51490 [Streptomyces spiroverticillatus]GHD04078.1 hypothetical protein GCM10010334_52430 [Streptomyces finlayi]